MARPKLRGPDFYSTEEVAKISGASLRQLQWWDESRLFPVQRKGHLRQWSPSDVSEVILVVALRKKGLSLQKMRSVLASYRRIKPDFPSQIFYLLVEPKGKLGYHLNVKIAASAEEVIGLFIKAKRPMILSVIQNVSKEKAA